MTAREPKRTRESWSKSPDVFKSSGGFTKGAKGGRGSNVSEQRPYSGGARPKGRGR